MINVFQPTVGKDELAAVRYVFESNWLGRGAMCELLERELAKRWGVPEGEVLLFNSCTSAIYVMMQALGIGPGDRVVLPDVHFVAAYNAVVDSGAKILLRDVDPRTLHIESAPYSSGFDGYIFLLHYGGHCCNRTLMRHSWPNAILLEDATLAADSTWNNEAVGTLFSGGVWSFDAMKIPTMGDGGALWLRDPDAREIARSLRYLGLRPAEASGSRRRERGGNWWEYEPVTTSGRYISNDIAAAIGLEQLAKLDDYVARRREVWRLYNDAFNDIRIITQMGLPPGPPPNTTSSYSFYWVQTEKRDELARFLLERGIYTTFFYWPLHRAFKCGNDEDFPGASKAADTTLLLPCHQGLGDDDVGRVIDGVKEFFESTTPPQADGVSAAKGVL